MYIIAINSKFDEMKMIPNVIVEMVSIIFEHVRVKVSYGIGEINIYCRMLFSMILTNSIFLKMARFFSIFIKNNLLLRSF